MATLREWAVRLWSTLMPNRRDQELEEELRLHLELAAEDEERRSGSSDESARSVVLRHGHTSQTMEALRDQRGLPWLDEAARDVRYAVRTLRKSPSFTAVAVLTLALGIGATTTIYSVVDAVLLQPLPFADSNRLVRVVENVASIVGSTLPNGIDAQDALAWRSQTSTLTDVVTITHAWAQIRTNDGTAQLTGALASANTFSVLDTRPIIGRTLGPDDEASPDVVVLTFDTWRRRFHADPDIVGTAVEFEIFKRKRLLTVVGVLSAAFEFPTERFEFYAPLVIDRSLPRYTGTMIGRLRPDVSVDAAIAEANAIGTAICPPPRGRPLPPNVSRFDVQLLKERVVSDWGPALRVFLAAVAVVLAIVCANIANLLLARGTARQREIAVRLAIGASRGRIVRQVLTECVVLAMIGGLLGAGLAVAGIGLITTLASVDAPGIFRLSLGTSVLPRVHEITIDPKMFGIAFGVAALASALFGVLPAVGLSRMPLTSPATGREGTASGASRLRSALVVGQLVMATVLLVGAGLLVRSFIQLSVVERGYDPHGVLAFQLVVPTDYSTPRKMQTIDSVLDRLRAMPGIEAAGFSRAGVLIREAITIGRFVPPGRTLHEMRADPFLPLTRAISPGYLAAIGARVLDGRELESTDAERAMPAIVITRSVARRFFPSVRAVGQIVDWHASAGSPVQAQVIGIVEDIRNESPDREPSPEIFIDHRQFLTVLQRLPEWRERADRIAIGFFSFAVRTAGDSASAIPAVSQIVRDVDPQVGIDAIIPLERLVASSVARQRFYAVMLGVFAAVAGLLAAIGVYGVLAYAVVQRTQEIGVRMALGAQRAEVLSLILRRGAVLTTVGVVLGLAGAAAATRVLRGMLFGITALDLTTFCSVALLFALITAFASYVPARRATKVDPLIALRHE